MLNIKILLWSLLLLLTGCFSSEETPTVNQELGSRDISYYADKSVAPLEVPPDLSKPDDSLALDASKVSNDIQVEYADFSKNKPILKAPTGISIKRSGDRRWLLVEKNANELWPLIKKFLTRQGFVIEDENKRVGLLQTNFLERKTTIPSQSLGILRSFLSKALDQNYATGIIDQYRFRLEPNDLSTEVFLTLTSMEEVVTDKGKDDKNTIWQPRAKERDLEVEMLYKLMLFLGHDSDQAKDELIDSFDAEKIAVKLTKNLGGASQLVFSTNYRMTWDKIAWALDELAIEVEDRDVYEGTFYVIERRPEDRNVLDKLFGKEALGKSYRLTVKPENNQTTIVSFNALEEGNTAKELAAAEAFLRRIAELF